MPDRLSIYHALPYPLKVLAASLRGVQLRWWRYGADTERLVAEALERETWSGEQWRAWQDERLAFILHRAATRVPYYREQWGARRRKGDHASWELLENWPILKKQTLRNQILSFIADNCKPQKMFQDHTGGTTGTPLTVFLRRETIQKWYSLYEARVRHWHGVSRDQCWGIMGGQMVIPLSQSKPPYWVWNSALNQLYLSTFHISQETAKHYAQVISKYKPSHLVIYPSSCAQLAREFLKQNLEVSPPSGIFSNAEPLKDDQEEVISRAFNCPVFETYGMGEIVMGASECTERRLHYWPESGILEVLDDISDIPTLQSGRIIATGLLNQDMPLIRYEVGDRGSPLSFESCGCGRKLPILPKIQGRTSDTVITKDGRRIFWLNPVFYDLPLIEAQIIQENLDQLVVLYVPSNDFSKKDAKELMGRLQARVGDMPIILRKVASIPRDKNGKFRAVISRVE